MSSKVAASVCAAGAALMLVQGASAELPKTLSFKGVKEGGNYIDVSINGDIVEVTEYYTEKNISPHWSWKGSDPSKQCTAHVGGDTSTWAPHNPCGSGDSGPDDADAPVHDVDGSGNFTRGCVGSGIKRIIPDGGLDGTDPAWGPYAQPLPGGELAFSEENTPKPDYNVKVHRINLATGDVKIKLAHPGLPGETRIVGKCVQVPNGFPVSTLTTPAPRLEVVTSSSQPPADSSSTSEEVESTIIRNDPGESLPGSYGESLPVSYDGVYVIENSYLNHFIVSVDYPSTDLGGDQPVDNVFKLRLHGSAEHITGANEYQAVESIPDEVQAEINEAKSFLADSDVPCKNSEESDSGVATFPNGSLASNYLNAVQKSIASADPELQLSESADPELQVNYVKMAWKALNAFASQCGKDCYPTGPQWDTVDLTQPTSKWGFPYGWSATPDYGEEHYCTSWAAVYTFLMSAAYADVGTNFTFDTTPNNWPKGGARYAWKTKTLCKGYPTEMECEPIREVNHFGRNHALKCTKPIPVTPNAAEQAKWQYMQKVYEQCPEKNPMKEPKGKPDEQKSEAFIVFNGSMTLGDWASNLNFIPVPYLGMLGHWGFHSEWKIHKKYTTIEDMAKGHPKVTFLGHSRGGAASNIAALWWLTKIAPETDVQIITAGGAETFFGGVNLSAILQFFCDYFGGIFKDGPIDIMNELPFDIKKFFVDVLGGNKQYYPLITDNPMYGKVSAAINMLFGVSNGGNVCDIQSFFSMLGLNDFNIQGIFHTREYKLIPQYAYINGEHPCGSIKPSLHDAVAFLNPIGHHPENMAIKWSTWWCNAVKKCKGKWNCKWEKVWTLRDWEPEGSQGNLLPMHRINQYVRNQYQLRPNSA